MAKEKTCPRCCGGGTVGAKCDWRNSTNEERHGREPGSLCDFCAKAEIHEETCGYCCGTGRVLDV